MPIDSVIQHSAFDAVRRRSRPDDRPSTRPSGARRGQGRGKIREPAPSEPRRGESRGGKSELRRAVRRVTPGRGNSKESGTENTPPTIARRAKVGKGEKVR